MIKGVNRQIIEVNDTDSELFERAIFFVRPGAESADANALHSEAQRIVDRSALTAPCRSAKKGRRRISRAALRLMIFALAAAVAVLAVLQFAG